LAVWPGQSKDTCTYACWGANCKRDRVRAGEAAAGRVASSTGTTRSKNRAAPGAEFRRRLAERDQRVQELEVEVTLLHASATEARAQVDPPHPSAASRADQAGAQPRGAARGAQRAAVRAAGRPRKMINDLLISSTYRREVLVNQEAAITPDERHRLKAHKKTTLCAIM